MRTGRMVLAAVTAGALTLGGGVALASTWTANPTGPSGTAAPRAAGPVQLHSITGKLVAVNPDTRTLVVKGSVVGDPKDESVSATVTGTSSIRQGWFHRKLSALKAGEPVRMVYEGTGRRWVADSVRILNPVVPPEGVQGPDIR